MRSLSRYHYPAAAFAATVLATTVALTFGQDKAAAAVTDLTSTTTPRSEVLPQGPAPGTVSQPIGADEQLFHVAGNTTQVNTDIKITSPIASTMWTANSTNTVTWTGTTPARFSVQLIKNDVSALEAGVSLRASVDVTEGSAACDTPNVTGPGFYVRFYDQLDIAKTVAVSDAFTIAPKDIQLGTSNGSGSTPQGAASTSAPVGGGPATTTTTTPSGNPANDSTFVPTTFTPAVNGSSPAGE